MHACNSIRVYIKMFDYMFVHVFEAHQIQVVSKETRCSSCKRVMIKIPCEKSEEIKTDRKKVQKECILNIS